ncbi:hypothetical protein FSP39_014836 [Pinctada imbricata]|uniref:EGF-like domain-containing protein n=1 Tax=Pinctada imbricata TaxID=66713 RepID=A0AA88YNY6_PINIB|nr:hypothetical protein FSP39_014836 [Pinctada imbricata]
MKLLTLAIVVSCAILTDATYFYYYNTCWIIRLKWSYCNSDRYLCQRDLSGCQQELQQLKDELRDCQANLTMLESDLMISVENATMCEEERQQLEANLTQCINETNNCTMENQTMCTEATCGNNGTCVETADGELMCLCPPGYCGMPCQPSTESTGATCSDQEPCLTSSSICVEGQCVCPCNYTYIPDLFFQNVAESRDACVRECPEGFSGTFVQIPGMMIGNDDGKVITGVSTIADCENMCVLESEFVCRSYEYRANTQTCTLNLARKDDNVRFIPSANKVYGERVCL